MKLARSKQSKTTNNQNQPTGWKRQCASFECLNTNVWAIHLITRHDVCTEWHMLPSQSYLYTHSPVAVLGLKLAHVLQPASPSHAPQPPQLPVMQNGGQEQFILIFTYWLRNQETTEL